MAEIISKRAETVVDWKDFLNFYLAKCSNDSYNKENNPNGYINLGTAVNNLCTDLVYTKLSDVWTWEKSMLQYEAGYGIVRLRKALAALVTEFFDPAEKINPDNIFCAPGVTGCIDLIAHCLADPGDVFLAPTPCYARIFTDCKQRSLVDIWPIPIISRDNVELSPVLTIQKVKKAYEDALNHNKTVRGIILLNPSNPLGDVYKSELLMDILEFFHLKDMHVVVDEVYALSVYHGGNQFHSVLKFPVLPDPKKVHVLYGMSKDFTVAGLRIGMVHTKCEVLQRCLTELCFLQCIPFPVMDMAARYLEDLEFCKKFVATNQDRLTARSATYAKRLTDMGLNVRKSNAAFFLWVDFRNICGSESFRQERNFFEYLIEKFQLYIVPGEEFFCAQPGWFRICFTAFPDDVDEGFNRLENAMKEYERVKM
ncbi:uncharacterized protein LOC129216922 [Uloborus diversus]|uniref:uncharacterized protein LOC129216922 n=1 Tax=Uloborus diversus TaxID=327109 RepID=UPI0024096D87|nr:uncharacterized protein LOC129216922 [Uloborus diversus]